MSVVCASFWHATGTVCSLPPGPVCSPAPGLASASVHKYKAQHDYKNDAEDKHKTADAEAMARLRDKRDTSQHHHAPTEQLHLAGSMTSRYFLSTEAIYLLYGDVAAISTASAKH